eukprot:CAMPEP_0167758534 /NCGR_PEP_ID=MMETSP0110_2-20121227/10521_1 /TAXON_ID=629695 /ORGANISM="Gymnochlora sp., Strain CCMP2014" /LENGTH=204 /DNA_ID=CAMNT_0007644819 /DNA_START=8 /DNA_END=619 /DNA_ORIENTATION=+
MPISQRICGKYVRKYGKGKQKFSQGSFPHNLAKNIAEGALGISMGLGLAGLGQLALPYSAHAESRVVGDFGASGIVFKDTLKIEALDDPKVDGVTLYISEFQLPITEKFQNFFSDPGSVGITCAKTGPIEMRKGVSKSKAGEEVFAESKSLFFGKSIRIRRIYDEQHNTLLYVSYSDRFDKANDDNKSRFKSSLCAIPLYEPEA